MRAAGLQLLLRHAHVAAHGFAALLERLLCAPHWLLLPSSEQVLPPHALSLVY